MILLYQIVAGLTDTGTGVFLLFAPGWTLRLMGVSQLPQPIWYASYIGVFVLCVGLSYFAILRSPLALSTGATSWRTQWMVTALIRAAVAMFILIQIATGAMQPAWVAVALTDGMYAGIQIDGLRRNWIALVE
jgi:hypothetical protein